MLNKIEKLEAIAQLCEERVWLNSMLDRLHQELRDLLDTPTTVEYKLALSLGPKKIREEEPPNVWNLGTVSGDYLHVHFSQPPTEPENKLKAPLNVRLAVRIMGLMIEEYTTRRGVVEKQLNKLIK